jgi:RHS repeat-associated protein
LKLTGKTADLNINGRQFHRPLFDNATLYTGNLMTITPNGYIKHYFAESERILSNVACGGHPMVYPDEKLEAILDDAYILSRDFTNFAENCFMNANDRNTTCEKSNIDLPADWSDLPNLREEYEHSLQARVPDRPYYFHADHLGSGSIITDKAGRTYQTLAYAPYGESLVNVRNGNDYDERHQFTGYEKDEETGLDYQGGRYYDPNISIEYSPDIYAFQKPNITPYNYCDNDPINRIDPDGNFSINNHYQYTYNALDKLGYSNGYKDLIAHYASVYADNPSAGIRFLERNWKRGGIDYSKTKNSQNTDLPVNSTWHAMTADKENVSNDFAMQRGQAFGWDKIIEASNATGTEQLEALGQGIHALQDAIAHKGVKMHGKNSHSLWNDMWPSKADANLATNRTVSAVIVSEVLGGNYNNVKNGMTIDVTGTTAAQYNQIREGFQKAVDGTSNKVILVGKPQE